MKSGRNFAALALVVTMAGQVWASGNVTVAVNNGNVKVTGQNNTEHSILLTTNMMGELVFDSLDGTTFNGQALLTVGGFNKNLRIDMKSGTKSLAVFCTGPSPFVVPGNLKITATGNDTVLIALVCVKVKGKTDITTKNGNDAIGIINGKYDGRVKIATGNGNDVVGSDDGPEFNGQVDVATGKGLDYVLAVDSTFFNKVNLKMGSDNDGVAVFDSNLASLNLNGNAGIDSVGSENTTFVLPPVLKSVENEVDPNDIADNASIDTNLNALVDLIVIVF